MRKTRRFSGKGGGFDEKMRFSGVWGEKREIF